MFTIVLAWINAKYKHNYCLLFLGTFIEVWGIGHNNSLWR